jgi:hypothetical protein
MGINASCGAVRTTDYPSITKGRLNVIDADTLNKIKRDGHPTIVAYTMEGCRWSDDMRDVLKQAAQIFSIPICEIERSQLEADKLPLGYPTVYLFLKGNQIAFSGNRTVPNLADFVSKNMHSTHE